jgi:hypothetical protein
MAGALDGNFLVSQPGGSPLFERSLVNRVSATPQFSFQLRPVQMIDNDNLERCRLLSRWPNLSRAQADRLATLRQVAQWGDRCNSA